LGKILPRREPKPEDRDNVPEDSNIPEDPDMMLDEARSAVED